MNSLLQNLAEMCRKGGDGPSLGYEFLWVVAGMVFSMAGGLLTVKILSNLLEIQQFGKYTLLFSVASFLISVLFTTLGQINLRYVIIARNSGRIEDFRSWQNSGFFWLMVLSAVLLLPSALYLQSAKGGWMIIFPSLLILTLIWGRQISLQFMLMAFRLRREIGISQFIGAIGRPLAVFLAVYWAGQKPEYAILGLALGFLLLLISQQKFLNQYWKKAEHDPDTEYASETGHGALITKNYLSYGYTYALIGLATVIVLITDRWLLSFFGTLKQVAIYAALMQVALAPVAFSHAVLTRLAAPILFGNSENHKPRARKRQYKVLLLVWAGIAGLVLLGATLFHPLIVRLLTNARFAEYSHLLPWMVLGLLLERTMQVLELKGSVLLKTRAYMMSRVLLIASVPLFEYLFFRLYGFGWLVMGLVLAAGLGVIATVFINRFVLPAPPD